MVGFHVAILVVVSIILVLSDAEYQNHPLSRIHGHLRKSWPDQRELQVVLLNKVGNGGNSSSANSSLYTSPSGKSSTKSGGTATCRVPVTTVDQSGDYKVEGTASTQVSFVYEVETAGSDISTYSNLANNTIPMAVDDTSVGVLADKLCKVWKSCIISFSLGSPSDSIIQDRLGKYCLKKTGQGACFAYNGNINVLYSTESGKNCTKNEIEELVLETLDGNHSEMKKGTYIQQVNAYMQALVDPSSGGKNLSKNEQVVVVRIVEGPNGWGGNGQDASALTGAAGMSTHESFSPGAWVAAALVALLLAVFFCLLRRCRRQEKALQQKLDDDMKSVFTDWSGQASSSGKTYMTADIRNLAGKHSKLDVHKCKSAMCRVCGPTLGVVNIMKVSPIRKNVVAQCREAAREIQKDLPDEKPVVEPRQERQIPSQRIVPPKRIVPSLRDDAFDDDYDDTDSSETDHYNAQKSETSNSGQTPETPKSMLL